MKALIYLDAGVSLLAFDYALKALEECLPSWKILPASHETFLQKNWDLGVSLVVFPGGRDTPYHERLKGKANDSLKNFIKKGGAYFGICAGGYYGSQSLEFEKGGDKEILAERELNFFPGKAIGPAFGKGLFEYGRESGARLVLLGWEEGKCGVYFNGGCYFENAESYEGVQIIGKYHDSPCEHYSAIILAKVGHGRALLTGVHPEFPLIGEEENYQRKKLFKYLILKLLA